MPVADGVITKDMIYMYMHALPTVAAASKLDKLIGLSAAMATPPSLGRRDASCCTGGAGRQRSPDLRPSLPTEVCCSDVHVHTMTCTCQCSCDRKQIPVFIVVVFPRSTDILLHTCRARCSLDPFLVGNTKILGEVSR